jgi:ferric-dicitrate binding protein FerR (iron transport regulator)
LYLKIAASLLFLVIAAATLYSLQDVSIHTAKGELKTIVLPDHSTVILNAGSFLHYNSIAFYFIRKVRFSGEGFFSVAKGSTFDVASINGSTQVLGTQFTILSREHRYEVSCIEGKVRVRNSDRTSTVILTANLQIRSIGKKFGTSKNFNPELITAWKQGEFYFENASLAEVLNTLELQYNVSISHRVDTARRYTGYFTNHNLEEALKLVCLPLRLNYKILQKDQIQISTNN